MSDNDHDVIQQPPYMPAADPPPVFSYVVQIEGVHRMTKARGIFTHAVRAYHAHDAMVAAIVELNADATIRLTDKYRDVVVRSVRPDEAIPSRATDSLRDVFVPSRPS